MAGKVRYTVGERFWEKVDNDNGVDECWEWNAYCDRDGYGKFFVNGEHVLAHRYSYQIHHGDIPSGMHVLHKCDNPSCVNPSHLFLGTHNDNVIDMMKKGRGRNGSDKTSGEGNGRAKLTADQVNSIRRKYRSGFSQQQIGSEYGVSQTTVSFIISKKTWKDTGS